MKLPQTGGKKGAAFQSSKAINVAQSNVKQMETKKKNAPIVAKPQAAAKYLPNKSPQSRKRKFLSDEDELSSSSDSDDKLTSNKGTPQIKKKVPTFSSANKSKVVV
jgi:hypothetical protein